MTRKLVVAQEKALGMQRSAGQLIFIDLPDQPESFAFQRLAKAIGNVASFRSLAPETRAQAIWMRCVQLDWQAKAIALANTNLKNKGYR